MIVLTVIKAGKKEEIIASSTEPAVEIGDLWYNPSDGKLKIKVGD